MKSEWKERGKEWVTANLGLKLLSVVLALVFFYTVRNTIGNVQTLSVPVELDLANKNLAVLRVDPLTVRVTFRGALSELRLLQESDLAVTVRPESKSAAGWETIPIKPRDIRGRRGRVISIEPSSVTVTYDQQVERELPVAEPTISGKPLRGRIEVEYTPKTVRVRGAELQLDQLIKDHVFLQTEPVDVEGRVQSFTRQVRVLPPGDIWLSGITPPEITVKVNIVTETKAREVENVPILFRPPPTASPAWRLEPSNAVVRVIGRPDAVQRLSKTDVKLFAEVSDLPPGGKAEAPLRVYLPPGMAFESVTVEPRSVTLIRTGD